MSTKYKILDQHGLNFMTCTTCGWVDLFTRAEFRDIVLESWRYCAEHKGLQIWGFVFMSNHIHLIANTKAPHKLENVMRDFKAHTAKQFLELLKDKRKPESRREWLLYLFRYFAQKLRGTQEFQVWQHDNHPIALYTEKVTIQKLRYIHANPVRARLVHNPQDWVYSSASNYAEGLVSVVAVAGTASANSMSQGFSLAPACATRLGWCGRLESLALAGAKTVRPRRFCFQKH